jgi:hypothetical protein
MSTVPRFIAGARVVTGLVTGLVAVAPAVALAKAPEPAKPITVIVTNATEVAKAHEGAWVVGMASFFVDVDGRVLDEISAQLPPHLQASGVQSVVGRSDLTVTPENATGFYLWDATTQSLTPASIQAGTYHTIQVTILNADDIVKQQRGSVTLFAGKLLNVNLKGKVNETAAALLLQELSAEGVSAMVAF